MKLAESILVMTEDNGSEKAAKAIKANASKIVSAFVADVVKTIKKLSPIDGGSTAVSSYEIARFSLEKGYAGVKSGIGSDLIDAVESAGIHKAVEKKLQGMEISGSKVRVSNGRAYYTKKKK